MAKFCMNCGTKLIPQAKFCPECGTKVSTMEPGAQEANPTLVIPVEGEVLSVEIYDELPEEIIEEMKQAAKKKEK